MAMTEDMGFPRLTPRDDRLQGGGKLFRRPEELTDEQFDLLAAAWADDALSGDSLAETEEVIASSPERRMRAESFRQIRLSPQNERWEGRNRMLKAAPGTYAIRRTLIVTLTVAAALAALVILGPLVTESVTRSAGPAVAEVQKMGDAITTAEAETMNEALIAEASPVIRTLPAEGVTPAAQHITQTAGQDNSVIDRTIRLQTAGVIAGSTAGVGKPQAAGMTVEYRGPAESIVILHDLTYEAPLLAAGPEASGLAPVELNNIISPTVLESEENWIVRGLSLLAEAITKEPKSVDKYFIANACVRGVNRVLGWDMELEQEKNNEGEPLATNFSSSLLTFSAPAKKTHP